MASLTYSDFRVVLKRAGFEHLRSEKHETWRKGFEQVYEELFERELNAWHTISIAVMPMNEPILMRSSEVRLLLESANQV